MSELGPIFAALADDTRRNLFTTLVESPQPLTLGELSERVPFTRQATRKHVRQLEHAGLVTTHQSGRRVFCQANPARLRAAYDWVAKYESFWTTALDDLANYVEFRQAIDQMEQGDKK